MFGFAYFASVPMVLGAVRYAVIRSTAHFAARQG